MSVLKAMFDPVALKMPDLKKEEIDIQLQKRCQYVDGAVFIGTATVGALIARSFFARRAGSSVLSKLMFILGTSFVFSLVGTQWSVGYCFKRVLSTPESKVGQRLRELLIMRGETPSRTTLLGDLTAGRDPTYVHSANEVLNARQGTGADQTQQAPVVPLTPATPAPFPTTPPQPEQVYRPLITPQNIHANPVWQGILSREYVPVPADNEARRATAEAAHQLPPVRHHI
jgi:hypothetical protein